MKPRNLTTKIFLDSGDAAETKQAIELLGFLDGQTTNPSLIAKSHEVQERLAKGEKFSHDEILWQYKKTVSGISAMIPEGSVSIEVYADAKSTAEDLLKQGREMFTWIPNAHIKYPTTAAGLAAAHQSVKEGIRVNMTLCFSQSQAAAVYAATMGATAGNVYVSPFVGRLDDTGENGMDLIKNTMQMYRGGDGHVSVLTASVRSIEHFLYAIHLGSDIITVPLKLLQEWAKLGMPLPEAEYAYDAHGLAEIQYHELNLAQDWTAFDIQHELTEAGIKKFSEDWNKLVN